MSPELAQRYQRYLNLMSSFSFKEDELDYSILERHRPFLERLDAVGNSAISVFDLCRREHAYMSPSYRERLGVRGPETGMPVDGGLDGLMHPDDLLASLDVGYEHLRFAMTQPRDERHHFKAIHDYRIRKSGDEWMRVVEQHLLLESDLRGNIWLSLSIIDVSPNQDLDTPFRGSVVDLRNDQVFVFARSSTNGTDAELTDREREVLRLVATGRSSNDIADQLFLSVHTVNRHRQNILRKTSTRNTAEAIRWAMERGLV